MGNSEIIYAYSVSDPRTISLSQLQKTEDLSYRKIWRSKLSGEQYEEYSVINRSNITLEEEMTIYERRRQQEAGLVAIKYVENAIGKQSLSAPWKQFRVFTERIPITLDEIACMSLPSALLLLDRVFISFNILFKEVGFFDVAETMIGIDVKCMPKVWMNSCWASNEPLNKGMLSGNLTHFEGIMVKRIFELVELHIRQEEIGNYMYEKNKIQQWTFELARAFVNYFITSQRVELPKQLIFSKKTNSLEALLKSNIRRQFSLKDPNYSLNLTIPEPHSSIPSSRNNPNKFMFDSAQFSARGQQIITSKSKPSYVLPSPKSMVGKSFSGITGLDFKQSTIKCRRQNQSQSIAKSNCQKKRNSEIFGFEFNQKKNRLQDHLINVTIQRQTSQSGYNFNSRSKERSYTMRQEEPIFKSFEIEEKKKSAIAQRKLQIQIPSSSQIIIQKSETIKFKESSKKDDRSSNSRSSGIQKSKLFSVDFNLLPESTFYTSTIQSTGFYSPMTKPKSHLFKNTVDQKLGMLFSQEILQHKDGLKTPNTLSPFLYVKGKDGQHSEIIAESNEQISEFPDKTEENKKAKTFLSQSITLEQMMIEPSKKNDKCLTKLDDYLMKKAIEKNQGTIKNDDINMANPKILAQSIIQTAIQL